MRINMDVWKIMALVFLGFMVNHYSLQKPSREDVVVDLHKNLRTGYAISVKKNKYG